MIELELFSYRSVNIDFVVADMLIGVDMFLSIDSLIRVV